MPHFCHSVIQQSDEIQEIQIVRHDQNLLGEITIGWHVENGSRQQEIRKNTKEIPILELSVLIFSEVNETARIMSISRFQSQKLIIYQCKLI